MSDKTRNNPERLTQLRAKIDAVDESIHGLLMQRASVIDELIRVKGAATQTGAAFRPGREAEMMEVLAERHKGSIPLTMVTHLWREIIATFTWLQANYNVHVALDTQAGAMRDMARFQFGFTVPLFAHETASQAIEAAAHEGNALALVSRDAPGGWWRTLDGKSGMAIMARLPAMITGDAGTPDIDSFVVAPPLSDPAPFAMRVYTGRLASADALHNWTGGEVLAQLTDADGSHHAMIAMAASGKAPQALLDIRAAGGYFASAGGQAA